MGTNLGVACRCLNIGPSLELIILTHAKVEPICIGYIAGPKKIIKHFRQAMGVTVIGLVEVLNFVENHGYHNTL